MSDFFLSCYYRKVRLATVGGQIVHLQKCKLSFEQELMQKCLSMSSFCLTFSVFNYIQFFRSIFETIHVSKYVICFKYSLLSKAQNKCMYVYDVMVQNILGKVLRPVWFVDFLCVPFFWKHRWPMSLSHVLAVWAAISNTVFRSRSNSCL